METLSSLRRQIEALKRKYAREIAAAVLEPVADKIVTLWDIATANNQPQPSPLICVRKVATAARNSRTPTKSSTGSCLPNNASNCPSSCPTASLSGSLHHKSPISCPYV